MYYLKNEAKIGTGEMNWVKEKKSDKREHVIYSSTLNNET